MSRCIYVFFTLLITGVVSHVHAQVSLPERNPFKLSIRGGAMSNNNDQAAGLKSKADDEVLYTVNTDYATIGEVELAVDLLRMRGASLGLQVSGMYSRPEFKAKGPDGSHRVGLTQMEIARANLTISFNGSDPYTMFELPYHSNKEAVLGITGMIIRTEKTRLTPYATDTLGIRKISGEYSQALGVTFGWNWRIGESGWVAGINGALMFVINKSHLVKVQTTENSPFESDYIDLAPRVLTAGIGYHF
jgi:hypothetical protein